MPKTIFKRAPKTVFISYRRDDTAPSAGRVYDRLVRVLKPQNVFFDVNAIEGGEDFVARIEAEIGRSEAALVFIGSKWLEEDNGTRRLFEPGDHVRTEIRTALSRPILVLPVLVGTTRMPRPEELPEDIKPITARNALLLRHESFDDDTENIVATVLGLPAKARRWEAKGSLGTRIAFGLSGVLGGAGLLLALALLHFWIFGRPLSASIGAPVTTALLLLGVVLGAWLGLRLEARKRKYR